MNPAQSVKSGALLVSLAISLCLHALPLHFIRQDASPAPPPAPPPMLAATLKTPPPITIPDALPELTLDAPERIVVAEPDQVTPFRPAPPKPPSPERPKPPTPPRDEALGNLPPAAARSARQQLERIVRQEGFYPEEAIAQGLEGETWIRIFLDENGNVIAARTERSSGFPILDRAAEKAARALKSLPADGLGDAVLPVIFRLDE